LTLPLYTFPATQRHSVLKILLLTSSNFASGKLSYGSKLLQGITDSCRQALSLKATSGCGANDFQRPNVLRPLYLHTS
jgi:hypothetical protein